MTQRDASRPGPPGQLLQVTRHGHLAPPIVTTVVAAPSLSRARDAIVSVQLGEAVTLDPRSAGHRHYQWPVSECYGQGTACGSPITDG
jgi:hypothetical protein